MDNQPVPQSQSEQPQIESQPLFSPTKTSTKLLKIVVGIFLIIIPLTLGLYVLQTKTNKSNTQYKTTDIKKTSPSVTPVPTSSDGGFSPILYSGIYKNHYGEYQIQLPEKWHAAECPGRGYSLGCIYIAPSDTKIDVLSPAVIIFDAIVPGEKNTVKNFNFNIPSVGTGLNAFFENTSKKITLSFLYRGAFYSFEGDYAEALKFGYSQDQFEQIIKNTANSITFLNEPSTCDALALLPLSDFPNNFTLYTYHDSDKTDEVKTYWPYTINLQDNSLPTPDVTTADSYRGFLVNYIKSGSPFSENASFLKTVTPIVGTTEKGGREEDTTEILHINCIDTQSDGPAFEQPHRISSDENNPFAIHVYGSSKNPNALWGVSKWNTNLLKTTRNVVYIKQGNLWQKYEAVNYVASMPTGYGGKPAIYLYPQQEKNIHVEIHPKGKLIITDSLYNPSLYGWTVSVKPDGTINNMLDSLYYEAMIPIQQPEKGFVIPYENLWTFTREYIEKLGLNEKESDAFIIFWKNRLPNSPYYFVSHLDQQIINDIYPLRISPKPDSLIRIELYFKPLNEFEIYQKPSIPQKQQRYGFAAVEWGGILDGFK